MDTGDQNVGIAQFADTPPHVPCTALKCAQRLAVSDEPQRAQSAAQPPQPDPELVRPFGVVGLQYSLVVDVDLLGGRLQDASKGLRAAVLAADADGARLLRLRVRAF